MYSKGNLVMNFLRSHQVKYHDFPWFVSVDQPEEVNLTAEEEVDDDDDEHIPDLRALRLNTENSHLFMDHANGTICFVALDSDVKMEGRAYRCAVSDISHAGEELPPIKHGNPITDRRSTFQPHLAPVVTPRQVRRINSLCLYK